MLIPPVLRRLGKISVFLAGLCVLTAAAPVTLVAVASAGVAWLRGWPPARLRRTAVWALPMTGVYLAGRAVQARTWQALALAPVHDYLAAWHAVAAGLVVTAFVLVAPVAVPAGLAAAGGVWAWRIYALDTGLSGKTATAPVVFDARQWKRQARTARARITAPGVVPLADRHGRVVMGATSTNAVSTRPAAAAYQAVAQSRTGAKARARQVRACIARPAR